MCLAIYWDIILCGRSGLWPFWFLAFSVCGHFGLWPFRSVTVLVCGRSGLWPFRSVAVSVCGRFGWRDSRPRHCSRAYQRGALKNHTIV